MTTQSEYEWVLSHGGSVSAKGGKAMLPAGAWKCCDAMEPEQVGECGEGCCDRYKCKSCGERWTYEWPD